MSNTIDKQNLVEWLDIEIDLSRGNDAVLKADKWAFQRVKKEIQSGAFDTSDQLREALQELKSSLQGVNKIVNVAIGHGEELHYDLLSNELARLEDIADKALNTSVKESKDTQIAATIREFLPDEQADKLISYMESVIDFKPSGTEPSGDQE